MEITMKTLYAGPRGTIQPGQTADLDDEEALRLLDGGYAVPAGQEEADGQAPRSVRPRPAKKATVKKAAPATPKPPAE